MPAYNSTTKGLEQRRQKRLDEQQELQDLRKMASGVKSWPKGEQRDRHKALLFFATCKTEVLIAAMTATRKALENKFPKI